MKRTQRIALAVLFSFVILGTPLSTRAVTPTTDAEVIQTTPGMQGTTDSQTVISDYVLPYPGILPDHPLYPLKRLRDYVLDRIIVDPVRKAEFHILQADKRLNMGLFLLEKGNAKLAEETVSKGEKYMYRAVFGLMAIQSSGKTAPAYMVEKLGKSLEKHREVLGDLVETANEPEKSGLEGSLELVMSLEREASQLMGQ